MKRNLARPPNSIPTRPAEHGLLLLFVQTGGFGCDVADVQIAKHSFSSKNLNREGKLKPLQSFLQFEFLLTASITKESEKYSFPQTKI